MDGESDLITIGQLAGRTGMSVRTLRFWADEGVVPAAGRSAGGYRLYDAAGVARVELVRTLRELGLTLGDVGRVLDGSATVAEVAAAHVVALDARIRSLKVSRAVLSTVAKRGSSVEETAFMNRLARLSAAERAQIIDEFKAEVFGGLDIEESQRERLRELRIELPDDPSPDQVDAWVELAELVRDPEFRTGMRVFLEGTMPGPGGAVPPGARIWWARQIVGTVAGARRDGVDPGSPAAHALVAEMFGDADRAAVLRSLEAGIDAGAERYRLLVARVRGQRSAPDATAELRWLATALRSGT
ncbi:MerR family transcriptional regulator [Actinoplanes philippinensis]|uniref:DNA-binding transcriptional regulator, MerR family n=1 Tax=Actinoplanes philippinensis TaxID=35752 RepID=A0A1I2CS97_9ACTN|nr:MerR family transcriptional regulator [Actinoplanes philippinensis]GIE74717.1 MerR family transcriptional regulator [Actinoplanes philippinensis]SFE71084.1 DNA-binding transcriptional regulator, MerR family [Actinoplanes philippinensis]